MIESIWRNHPGKFGQLFGSNPRTFWEQLPADDPKLALGQLTCLDNWQDITYPFIVHGDGGVYSRKTESSLLVVSAKSMLAAPFQSSLIPVFALPKLVRAREAGDGADTSTELWRA